MTLDSFCKSAFVASIVLVISACGGGGGGGSGNTGGGPTNSAPVADAGSYPPVDEQTSVTLDGTASSDPDGDTLTYSWTQTGGVSVSLANAGSSQATFTGPDVGIGSSTTLTFRLSVSDPSGASNAATVDVIVNGVSNSEPVVDAGVDQSATELEIVSLTGSASDTDIGDTLTYAWTQLLGTAVSISGSDTANASFEAPAVGDGGETLTFQLSVNDGTATITDTVDVAVSPAQPAVSVSGKVEYEQPQPNTLCRGYDFDNVINQPIRRVPVQLLDAANNLLATTTSLDDGSYAFTNVPSNTDVRIRVRAELVQTGSPSWDVKVRDNTSDTSQPLTNRPIYVVQWSLFNTGTSDSVDNNFLAATGWGGSGYTGTRAAAPFAILDTVLDAINLVVAADPDVTMGPLDVFWSVNNTLTGESDFEDGRLPTTFYSSNPDGNFTRNPSLFLLGDAEGRFPDSTIDTDEFDRGVIAHEWGHYFEDELSRSDSIGGRHVVPGTVEPRVAFGEGWGYGFAGMAIGNPQVCDTGAPASSGFEFNVETPISGIVGTRGFFNEVSLATFLYDLWDTADDGLDDRSIGFAPIYNTMVGPQANTEAFTTVFSFATELRSSLNATDSAFVDALLNRDNIDTDNLDIWGSGQTTVPAGSRDLLPIYTVLPTNGSIVQVCANSDFAQGQDGNKPGEWRYLRFTTTSTADWTITAVANPVPPPTSDEPGPSDPPVRDRSDPDLWLYRDGEFLGVGGSGDADIETFTTPVLSADTYVIALQEWRYEDPDISSDFPTQVCFDVSMTP